MFRRTKSTHKNANRKFSGMETLENRQLMAGDVCFGFENLPIGFSGTPGKILQSNFEPSASISLEPFVQADGDLNHDGFARVTTNSLLDADGNVLELNNIVVSISGRPAENVSLDYLDQGVDNNFGINNDFRVVSDLTQLDGETIGGTLVTVVNGSISIDGIVESLEIGGQEFFIDNVCGSSVDGSSPLDPAYDYGDAPAPYPTLLSEGGAVHRIDPTVYLGSHVDAEADGQPTPYADGDDANQNAGYLLNDESGVTFSELVPGQSATVEVDASQDGFLSLFIDYHSDGNWDPASSDVVFRTMSIPAGISTHTFTVPVDAVVHPDSPTFARVRYSTDLVSMTATNETEDLNLAPVGEVQDHAVFITNQLTVAIDTGNAPSGFYDTIPGLGGPFHVIEDGVQIGNGICGNSGHDFVNECANRHDDDGINLLSPFFPGQTASIEIEVSRPGFINLAWDLNNDGQFEHTVFSGRDVHAGANTLQFDVPEWATPHPQEPTYARLRYSTNSAVLTPNVTYSPVAEGVEFPNGEMQDFQIFIDEPAEARLDFGDAGDSYLTLAASNGPTHVIQQGVFLGKTVDAERDATPTAGADGDDLVPSGSARDEDGVRFQSPIVPGRTATVDVFASADGFLNTWFDFNASGTFDAGEKVYHAHPLTTGVNRLTFSVPANAATDTNAISRWRFSSIDSELSHFGPSENGEVEDHLIYITEEANARFDFGDAPDQPYPTLRANNGAWHRINPNVRLGDRIDGENDGQPTPLANGDDVTPSPLDDDEDGVQFPFPLVVGNLGTVVVDTSTNGFLNAWIDLNGDGIWSAGMEHVFAGLALPAGTHTLQFPIPNGTVAGEDEFTFARFRFSSNYQFLAPTGGPMDAQDGMGMPDGEVEDYRIQFLEQPEQANALNIGLPVSLDEPYFDFDASPPILDHGLDCHLRPLDCDGRRLEPQGDLIAGGEATLKLSGPLGYPATIHLDVNNDGRFDQNELFSDENIKFDDTQNAESFFDITYEIEVVDTLPADTASGPIAARVSYFDPSTGGIAQVVDQLIEIQPADQPQEQRRLDWGDAPDNPYPTLRASDGARHEIDPNLHLGLLIDAERNGKPSISANRDDVVNQDDEDGVRLRSPMLPGGTTSVDVFVTGSGKLDAWVDFDQDGIWEAGEQIFSSTAVNNGINSLQFNVPVVPNFNPQQPLYSRFRLSTAGGLSPRGFAEDGEVEDYKHLCGDLNGDQVVDQADINRLMRSMRGQDTADSTFDLNGDGLLNRDDIQYWVGTCVGTSLGDVDLDGAFGTADLISIFAAGKYEDGTVGNSEYGDGDVNGDGETDSSDLIAIFATGEFDPVAAILLVEEPASDRSIDAAIQSMFLDNDEDSPKTWNEMDVVDALSRDRLYMV